MRLNVTATGMPSGRVRCLQNQFSLCSANNRILFQSSAPQSIAQVDMNMTSARTCVVFWGSRLSVSVANLVNSAFDGIAKMGYSTGDEPALRLADWLKIVHVFAVQ